LGNPPPEPLDGEIEAEIPREILAAEKRAIRRNDAKFLSDIGVARLQQRLSNDPNRNPIATVITLTECGSYFCGATRPVNPTLTERTSL